MQVSGKHSTRGVVHRVMNSITYPHPARAVVAIRSVQLGALVTALLILSGCGRRPIIVQAPPAPPAPTATVIHTPAPAPAPQPVVGTATRDVVIVREAPPPPRDEPPPPPPPSGSYTWVPGYWSIRDGRQEWVPGRYEMPPRAEATWVAPRWERRADGYVFVDGYWR